jgi:hypothetical protein
MSLEEPQLGMVLHRIEVHGGPHQLENGETLRWSVRIGRQETDVIYLGYLRRREVDGYGQAQAFAWRMGNGDPSAAEWSRERLVDWGARNVFEALWDVCRRALQAQASVMDFQFDLDVKAPEPTLKFDEDESPEALEEAEISES